MPELPEVETVRMQLEQFVVSETISEVLVRTPSIVHGAYVSLKGTKFSAARRFSKLLVLDTSGGYSLAIHLKMTGRLVLDHPNHPDYRSEWEFDYATNPHTHLVITFLSKAKLYFNDYRRFGTIDILPTANLLSLPYIKNLGKEFFVDLTAEEFYKSLQSTSRAIKVVLLDQTKVGGVGNIYANEALWQAKIHPETPAKQISHTESDRLFQALEEVMTKAKKYLGASSDNFRNLFGKRGSAQNHFIVYGKEHTPCPRCGTLIEKYFVGGRGTYKCPVCQKLD